MKVDLSSSHNLKDRHVKTLVERCNKITELDLSYTSITNDCVDSIATHLNSSLEKLDVSHTKIDSTALLRLGTVRTLKVLNCLKEEKIDEIENKISKNIDFNKIISELNIKPIIKKDYINLENKETIENKIYNSRKNKIEILEDNGTFIFYQIDNSNSKLPNLDDDKFIKQMKNLLFQKEKFEFNKNILNQINKEEFNQISFDKLGGNGVEKIKLNSTEDDAKFEINSVEVLYSMPINSFTLITDDNENIFIAKTTNFEDQNISKNSEKFNSIVNEASAENRNGILKSYDYLLEGKYKVVINEKTLDRVKNYFR